MVIKIENFKLKHCKGVKRFDLHIVKIGKKLDTKRLGKKIETPLAYNLSIEKCVDLIVQEKMEKDLSIVDLKTFLKEYKRFNEEIVAKLNNIIENIKFESTT